MSFIPEITLRGVTLAGGLTATCVAVWAEAVAGETSVATGSFLLGGAGLIAAISAFTKDFWTDRQKQREHETFMLRIKLRTCRNCGALQDLYGWARSARAAVPALPPVPELRCDVEESSSTSLVAISSSSESENAHV